MNEINEIIRLNKDNKLNINYLVGTDLNNNDKQNITDYVLNSLWAKLRAYNFENIINSHDFDIHVFNKHNDRQFNFNTDDSAVQSLADIQVILERIGRNVVKELNDRFPHISYNISTTLRGVNLIDPSVFKT
jgi:hypothetical protein